VIARPLFSALLLVACAQPNLRPDWIRTAGSAYGCPQERLAAADTSRSFAGRDPRLFDIGTPVCEVIALADLPSRVTPDRRNVASVREVWSYSVTVGQATHTVLLTLEGPTRREMSITEKQDIATPATAPAAESGGRRRRG
jgi:hypothetical protein